METIGADADVRSRRALVEFVRVLLLGLFGIVLNQLFFVVGLARTSAIHAAIVVVLMPVLVLLYAVGFEVCQAATVNRKLTDTTVELANLKKLP